MDLTTITEEKVLREIEALRKRIEETYRRHGDALTSTRILQLSRRLDRLILSYLRKEPA